MKIYGWQMLMEDLKMDYEKKIDETVRKHPIIILGETTSHATCPCSSSNISDVILSSKQHHKSITS